MAGTVERALKARWLEWCVGIALAAGTPVAYLAFARYNLPVCANGDERTALAVLSRFYAGSLNPQFFMYPTLYYYGTYGWTRMFGFADVLFWGRALNLGFVGLTGWLAYLFCREIFGSRAAGGIAAACTVTSATLVESGSYLCTDALLAATAMGSTILLQRYFERPDRGRWLAAMLAVGIAVGCKYTAFLLFVVYVAGEMWAASNGERQESNPITDAMKPRRLWGTRVGCGTLVAAFAGLGVALIGAGIWFPTGRAMAFAYAQHSNADQRTAADYLRFFAHVRRVLEGAGVGFFVLGAATGGIERVYRAVSPKRLYFGLAIVILVSIACTPYSVVTPAKFLYDLGALARGNLVVAGGHAAWREYLRWAVEWESPALLSAGLAGMGFAAWRDWKRCRVAILFLPIYAAAIGSAPVGFPRYLGPVLPFLFCFAAIGMVKVWRAGVGRWYPKAAVLGFVCVAAVQIDSRVLRGFAEHRGTDAFWQSFRLAEQVKPERVLFAGDAPSVELSDLGMQTRQVSWASLSGGAMGAQMGCGDLLIYDLAGARARGVGEHGDASVRELLHDARGNGQEVVRRSGCSRTDREF